MDEFFRIGIRSDEILGIHAFEQEFLSFGRIKKKVATIYRFTAEVHLRKIAQGL